MDAEKRLNYKSLLISENRDFFIRNNGEQVKAVEALEGRTVGIYFSAHWCGPCRRFTPKLAEVYSKIRSKHGDKFEVVFVSGDGGQGDFNGYFSEMPWLAVPFSDEAARERLDEAFEVQGIPHLVIVDDRTGEVVMLDAVGLVEEHGAEAFPFTRERVAELKEEAMRNQSVMTVLTSPSRDYVISADGTQVRVSELEGKMVAIYFASNDDEDCVQFSLVLSKMYSELKQRGEAFEVVLVALDEEEEDYMEQTKEMPWLALPFKDQSIQNLIGYFELQTVPTLVLLGADGKTMNTNLVEIIEENGVSAYPFSPAKLSELAELERKRMEEQTLESLLVSDELDYVVGKDGAKVPVKDLVGKTILLYFSAHWCPPCRAFTPKLANAYTELKAQQSKVEVIFISSDYDRNSFDEYYSSMPWLALPFEDRRGNFLNRKFKVQGIPTLVALNEAGRTITTAARGLIADHGAKAFPFTEEHVRDLPTESENEDEDKLIVESSEEEDDDDQEDMDDKDGFVCDGEVCRKV